MSHSVEELRKLAGKRSYREMDTGLALLWAADEIERLEATIADGTLLGVPIASWAAAFYALKAATHPNMQPDEAVKRIVAERDIAIRAAAIETTEDATSYLRLASQFSIARDAALARVVALEDALRDVLADIPAEPFDPRLSYIDAQIDPDSAAAARRLLARADDPRAAARTETP